MPIDALQQDPVYINSAASTNATLLKAGKASMTSFIATNNGAAVAFVKLFNKAVAPIPGTDVPVLVLSVPANGVPLVLPVGDIGPLFVLGLGLSITNLIADNDVTVVAANQVKIVMGVFGG